MPQGKQAASALTGRKGRKRPKGLTALLTGSSTLAVACGQAGSRHAFAQAAILDEILFQAADLAVQQEALWIDDLRLMIDDLKAEGRVAASSNTK